ncbi:MAG: AlpA family phage regulatory protein [Gammaproteobacteria bacterium]|jgi:prophage regulatory protein|nr:AlpA family phage regulatory protein [Gammaproteobacteria bacterium]
MKEITFLRLRSVLQATGLGRATVYEHIARGTFPKPVTIGGRSVAWAEHEIQELNRARLAGATDDEIRELVERLHRERSAAKEAA